MDSNTILFNSKHKIYFPASKNCPAAAVINRGIRNRGGINLKILFVYNRYMNFSLKLLTAAVLHTE